MRPKKRTLELALVLFVVVVLAGVGRSQIQEESQTLQDSPRLTQVYGRVGRELDPRIYGEFVFLSNGIRVKTPGRLLQDFGITGNSILVEGNGQPLKTDEDLGRCMVSYQRLGELTLKWSRDQEMFEKTLMKSETSFYTIPRGHDILIEDR